MQSHPLSTALVRLNLKLHIVTVLRIVPVLASRAASSETSAALLLHPTAASWTKLKWNEKKPSAKNVLNLFACGICAQIYRIATRVRIPEYARNPIQTFLLMQKYLQTFTRTQIFIRRRELQKCKRCVRYCNVFIIFVRNTNINLIFFTHIQWKSFIYELDFVVVIKSLYVENIFYFISCPKSEVTQLKKCRHTYDVPIHKI